MEKLPKKWCIKWGNKENFKIIQEHLEKVVKHNWEYNTESFHSKCYVDNNNKYYGIVKPDLPEITFEQFCNWVLNANCEPLIFN